MISKSWRLSIVTALLFMLSPALSSAQVSVSVSIAPPELPVYDQPPIPGRRLHLDARLLGVGR